MQQVPQERERAGRDERIQHEQQANATQACAAGIIERRREGGLACNRKYREQASASSRAASREAAEGMAPEVSAGRRRCAARVARVGGGSAKCRRAASRRHHHQIIPRMSKRAVIECREVREMINGTHCVQQSP